MHFLFAWRYFKAKKSTNAINIISWICIIAIMIGSAALILVLSVFNGFEGLVKSLYSSFYPSLKISPATGKVMTITQEQLNRLQRLVGDNNYSLVLEEKAILQYEDNQSLIYLKGVDANYKNTSGVAEHIVDGSFNTDRTDTAHLVIGSGISASLGVRPDARANTLTVYIPRNDGNEMLDAAENVSTNTITLSGVFSIQQDFDNRYGITNINFLRTALRLPADSYSGVEILVKDASSVPRIKAAVQRIFGHSYLVQNRYEQNKSLYSIMNLERWAFYGILCLILVVAAFNMIGALTMLVLEKEKDISILNALGAGRRFILRIFLNEGFLLAIVGGALGIIIAIAGIVLQQQFHLIPLEGGSFLINYFPVQLKLTDILLVIATIFVIAFISSWVPAVKASKREFSLRSE